jgi:putative transcriptional regulator
MPKTEDELLERDAGRDIGTELLESLREMKAGDAGALHSAVAIARYLGSLPVSAADLRR